MGFKYNSGEKRKRLMAAALGLCFASLLLCSCSQAPNRTAMARSMAPTVVIDAGHGGIDGGAVSDDGTKESDLNLAIALRLECIVRFLGHQTVMTRLDDSRKTDMIGYSERQDLKNRAELVNSVPNAVLISIHQNDFPTAQPRGAQVLFSAYGDSRQLAERIQGNLIEQLDPQNRRLAVSAPRNLYLTANTRCPAVLVECGFMSNNFEVLRLRDSTYQTSLALVIAGSYQSYLNEKTVLQ